jgi:predicted phage tail protein
MSLQKTYDDVQTALADQKYKVAMDVVNIKTRIDGLLSEVANLKDVLNNIKTDPVNVAVCDADEINEIQAVIDKAANVQSAVEAISIGP